LERPLFALLKAMASLELPHWLIILGTLLVLAGLMGAVVSRRKLEAAEPPSDGLTDAPDQQMPPLPSLLESGSKRAQRKKGT
jgi:hypothetical protein